MKNLLIIPGIPLALVTIVAHDPGSTLSSIVLCALVGIGGGGSAFLLLYALARAVSRILKPHR